MLNRRMATICTESGTQWGPTIVNRSVMLTYLYVYTSWLSCIVFTFTGLKNIIYYAALYVSYRIRLEPVWQ